MQKRRHFWIACGLTLLVSSCASVEMTKTAKGYHAPTDASEVQILKTVPDEKYVELGTFTVTGFMADETAEMYNAIRTKASALGAEAVIITDEGLIQSGFSMKRWGTGVAIDYTDDEGNADD